MTFDYDCRCPICDARARGVWPAFVEPEPVEAVEPGASAIETFTLNGDLDADIWAAVVDHGFDP